MKFFITGGAGFIGSNLINKLLNKSDCEQVVIFDNLKSGKLAMIESSLNDSRVSFVHADINDLDLLKKAMIGCNTVYHLAANPDISKAESDPMLDFREGTMLTQHVLEAARINRVSNIIFTSGSGVYGEVPGQVFSEGYGPCFPVSPYGAAKLGSEALISAYCNMFGIRGLAFRFANVVGPNQTHGVGYDFIHRLLLDSSHLKILGDGTQCKSYIYISDVLNAIELAVESKSNTGLFDVYNVATNDYVTVTEIAKLAYEVIGVKPENYNFIYSGGDRGWNGDVPKVLFNTDKIRCLGWSNRISSREAIKLSLQEMYLSFST